MMKIERLFRAVLICSILMFTAQAARAQSADEQEEKPQPPRYRMELLWIVDGDSEMGEYVFLIGAIGLKRVEGLKNFVARLPKRSILEWSPGCLRRGDEPLLSSVEEMEDFKRFCSEHGIEFILHPSG